MGVKDVQSVKYFYTGEISTALVADTNCAQNPET
jgi:hypothetical protein